MKHRRYGFTLVELLAVLAIMAVLVGVLIPAVNMVRRTAKKTAQKAQFASIDMGLMAFKGDYGDYPPSDWGILPNRDLTYCGAQRLAEALVGLDLLGFNPYSKWMSDGTDPTMGTDFYPDNPSAANLSLRKGPYLELATTNAFRLGNISIVKPGLFNNTGGAADDTFVLCDVYGKWKVNIGTQKLVKAGTPILYYKANPTWKTIEPPTSYDQRIYSVYDNSVLVDLIHTNTPNPTKLRLIDTDTTGSTNLENLYLFDYEGGIKDSKITTKPWPHRPDSYILISAGADGLYGTSDDIRNF